MLCGCVKDRPERAIYNPARRAVQRQKDVTPSASAAECSHGPPTNASANNNTGNVDDDDDDAGN